MKAKQEAERRKAAEKETLEAENAAKVQALGVWKAPVVAQV